MTTVGIALSCAEHTAVQLVRHASRAEEAGFSFALITDHDHPWTDDHASTHLWSVLGAVAQATERMRIGAGLACPTAGIDPLLVHQASSTIAELMPGRLFLGLMAGEAADETIRMIRGGGLPEGGGAQRGPIRSVPETAPIYLTTTDATAARLSARVGDGIISVAPDPALVEAYRASGGGGPTIGHVRLCWDATASAARRTAEAWASTAAIDGDPCRAVPCGPDAGVHLARIQRYVDAGYDRICLEQLGPDQAGFIRFAEGELLPALRVGPVRLAS